MTPACLALAYGLDLACGDPEWFPHPVRWFGWLTSEGERRLRPGRNAAQVDLLAGGALTCLVVSVAWALGRPQNPVWQVLFAWTALATRSLLDEAGAVIGALEADDLALARQRVARIVGRDTAHLGRSEVAAAVIETLAESTCDGIVAPLFWLSAGGLKYAMVYKAVNTLDSMIGHPEPPYRYFGRVAARLDDFVNLVPARLTALAIVAGARLSGSDAKLAFHIWCRDSGKHASPNAGQSEAAMAGALGVRLGGPRSYNGRPYNAPELHPEGRAPSVKDARRALTLVAVVSGITFGVVIAVVAMRSRR